MNHFKFALWRFTKGLVVGFFIVELLLLAIFVPTVGASTLTVVYTTSLAGLLAVLIGFQELLNPSASVHIEETPRRGGWKLCFSPWEMAWKTWLLSTISTFCLNIVGWSAYWLLGSENVVANVIHNLGPIAVFSMVVGIFYGAYHFTKFWMRLT